MADDGVLTFALAFALCSFSSITPPAASGCATSLGCCFATAAEDDISANFVVFLDTPEIECPWLCLCLCVLSLHFLPYPTSPVSPNALFRLSRAGCPDLKTNR